MTKLKINVDNKLTPLVKCEAKSTPRTKSFMQNAITKALSLSIFASSFGFSALAETNQDYHSGTAIERIVVTSDFSQRSPDNLASSVAIVSEQLLNVRQAEHLEDIIGIVPNLNFSSGASRGKFVQIRGIGERSLFAEPINASVALVVDEINFSGLGGLGALFDVQQVEVLSGPQSTGFGASG